MKRVTMVGSTSIEIMADDLANAIDHRVHEVGNMTLTITTLACGTQKVFIDSACGEIAVVGV